MAETFEYKGWYRLQSRRDPIYSHLAGKWLGPQAGCLTSEEVNACLRRLGTWKSGSLVNLRPARVNVRTGAFNRDLESEYFNSFFTPENGSEAMSSHVLDVGKVVTHWHDQRGYYIRLTGVRNYCAMESIVSDVSIAAVNKYICHGGGHLLGWDIEGKYSSGYFRITGKTSWPLIFVEDFRADLHSFGLALALLPPKEASAVFLFHLLRRVGMIQFGIENECGGPGASPYLLVCLLYDLGFLRFVAGKDGLKLDFASLDTDQIIRIMRLCDSHAFENFTRLEFSGADAADIALNSALYYRRRVTPQISELFSRLLKWNGDETEDRSEKGERLRGPSSRVRLLNQGSRAADKFSEKIPRRRRSGKILR